MAVDNDNGTYWTTDEGVASATLEYVLPAEQTFDRAMLQEYIRVGQRVERFHIDAWDGTHVDTGGAGDNDRLQAAAPVSRGHRGKNPAGH